MERIFVRFPSSEAKIDALHDLALPAEPGNEPKFLYSQPDVMLTPADDAVRAKLETAGAQIFEDVKFSILPPGEEIEESIGDWSIVPSLGSSDELSLQDVVEQVRAPEAWRKSRGRGVTIAIVDTGIATAFTGIAAARRSAVNLPTNYEAAHWLDPHGHGTMCAAIAASSRADGGRYDGIAPEATVLSGRTTLNSTDLADVYDELVRARHQGLLPGPLVVSNSYGLRTCKPLNVLPADHPYMTGILAAIDDGIFFCFAAGNWHRDLCKHDPTACGPNSIWGPNSHDRVVSVGTVNRDLTN